MATLSDQERNEATIRDIYYPRLFDGGDLSVADGIFAKEARNSRHPENWPAGPEGFKKVVRELNGKLGGGLDDLTTLIIKIFAEGDTEVYALTRQTGVHNGNGHMPGLLPSLESGTLFEEIQLHHWKFDNHTHKILSHEVQFWPTENSGKMHLGPLE